jgi:hypothetical protein
MGGNLREKKKELIQRKRYSKYTKACEQLVIDLHQTSGFTVLLISY